MLFIFKWSNIICIAFTNFVMVSSSGQRPEGHLLNPHSKDVDIASRIGDIRLFIT
jgi:hypothetical protein